MRENKINSNLIRTDTFLYKIKMFFANLFTNKLNKKVVISDANNSCVNNIKNFDKNGIKEKFIDQIKIKDNNENEIQKLVKLLKSNSISIEDLTAEQKEEIILFLQKEIAEKKLKLKNIKNKKLYNKLTNNNDINLILSTTPPEEKTSFIEYLKEQINIKRNKLQKLKANNI